MKSTINKIKNQNETSASLDGDWINQLEFADVPAGETTSPEITVVSFPDLNQKRSSEIARHSIMRPHVFSAKTSKNSDAPKPAQVPTPMNQSIVDANSRAQRKHRVDQGVEILPTAARVDSLETMPVSGKTVDLTQPDKILPSTANPVVRRTNQPEPVADGADSEVDSKLKPQVAPEKKAAKQIATGRSDWLKADEANAIKIEKLTDQLIRQFPPVAPAALMFVSTQSTNFSEVSVARMAASLAGRATGSVLLIDASCDQPFLSGEHFDSELKGLSEVVNRDVHWKDCVAPTTVKNLSFLPAGIEKLSHRKCNPTTMRAIINQLKSEYKYVIINAASATHPTTTAMCSTCDGTYVVVSINDSAKNSALAAVQSLEKNMARILGAIVVEAESV